MVYGQNMAICSECCNGYVVGDSIPLGEKCPDCNSKSFKWTSKDKLKQEVQAIMNDALAGYIDKYKYMADDGKVYVRWGRVRRHINEAIDLYWPKGKTEK